MREEGALIETTRKVVSSSGTRIVSVSATASTKVVTLATASGDVLLQLSDRQARALAEALLDAASEAA